MKPHNTKRVATEIEETVLDFDLPDAKDFSPEKIIWNSEELEDGTIGDGTGTPEKSNVFGLLFAFLNNSTLGPGLFISGDGIPNDWIGSAAIDAINVRSAFLGFNVVTSDHKTVGLGVNPKSIGTVVSAFHHVLGPDTMIVYGGCLGINKFDVMVPQGSAVTQMRFNGNPAYASVISQTTTNGRGGGGARDDGRFLLRSHS